MILYSLSHRSCYFLFSFFLDILYSDSCFLISSLLHPGIISNPLNIFFHATDNIETNEYSTLYRVQASYNEIWIFRY